MIPAFANPVLKMNRQKDRRIEGVRIMGRSAIGHRGTKFDPPGGFVPNSPEYRAIEDFSAVIIELNLRRKVIGKAAGVSTETVKAWENGRQIPHSETIFRMAKTFPSVRRWALRKLGVDEMPQFMSPQVVSAMMAAMYQVAHQPGPDGDAIRAALSKIGRAQE